MTHSEVTEYKGKKCLGYTLFVLPSLQRDIGNCTAVQQGSSTFLKLEPDSYFKHGRNFGGGHIYTHIVNRDDQALGLSGKQLRKLKPVFLSLDLPQALPFPV